jgi:hypothetical protein
MSDFEPYFALGDSDVEFTPTYTYLNAYARRLPHLASDNADYIVECLPEPQNPHIDSFKAAPSNSRYVSGVTISIPW